MSLGIPVHAGISLVAQTVKCLSTMWETWVRSLGWEVSLRRKWQPSPVLLPRKIPWMEKPSVHGVAKSRTRLNDFTFFHFHFLSALVAQMVKNLPVMQET